MGPSTSALTDLRHTIELALRGAVTVSGGASRLPEHRVPAMAPLRVVPGSGRSAAASPALRAGVFTGVAHCEDLAA